MNTLSAVAFLAALAFANAGLWAGPSASVLQGPSSRSTIVGPDGSAISAVAPGGQIITEEHPGVVAHSAGIVASPVLAHSAGVWGHSGIVAAPSVLSNSIVGAHGLVASAPIVHSAGIAAHGLADTVVSGPSGVISTRGHLGAPGVIAHGIHGVHGIHNVW